MTRSSFASTNIFTTISRRQALPTEAMPIGKARIARAGRDLTIVTYSAMLHEALAAAEEMAGEGAEIEVVDLRSIKPLDTDTVLASVARTGRLLCVGEAWPWGGVTAEVIARVATEGFGLLDAPPQRLNAKDTPIPYHPNLWRHAPAHRAQHRRRRAQFAANVTMICHNFPSSCPNWASPSPRPPLSVSSSSWATRSRPTRM